MKNFIEVGKIVSTHGIRGEMRLQPWTDSPEFLVKFNKIYFDENGVSSANANFRCHKTMNILKIKGIDTIEQAETYRDKIVYVSREDIVLQKGKFLLQDIIGCKVFNYESNFEYGVVVDVSQLPANDVWHIKYNDKEYLFPAVPNFIIEVNLENEKILINPPKGIFDYEN